MKLLIDADSVLYRAAIESEVRIERPDTGWVSIGFHKEDIISYASGLFSEWILGACEKLGVEWPETQACFYFTDSPRNPVGPGKKNFRKKIYSAYKENRVRSGSGKPHGFYYLLEHYYTSTAYSTTILPGLEADDCCGIAQTVDKRDTCIVSIDKDMKTVPGLLYNPDTAEVHEISEKEAERNHMMQTLTGDSTDNYPGLPGVGPKTAAAAMEKIKDWRDFTKFWSEKTVDLLHKGKGVTDLQQQAQMAKILTTKEWDYKNNRVIPFTVPALSGEQAT